VPFTDANTGLQVVRISDPSAMGGGNGQELGINYSSNAAFNSDGTLLKLNKNGAVPAYILDTSDWSVAYTCSNMPAYPNWSFLNPLKVYGMQNSNEFCILDVPTNVRTTQFTFTNYTSVSIGEGEGRQDRNDKYVCLVGTRVATGDKWLIVYDIQLQSIFAELNLGSAGGLDNATISPLGNYVVVNWGPNGAGAEQGFKVYDNDLTNLRHLWDDSEHSDVGIDVNGDEVLVAFAGASRPDSFSITMVRLVDAVRQGLWFDDSVSPTGGIWGGHISCTNWKRDGYAYITVNDVASNVYRNEVVALRLDYVGSNIIEMFGTAHNNSTAATLSYNHELKGSASPDGTRVAFNANWGDTTLINYTHAPAWVMTSY